MGGGVVSNLEGLGEEAAQDLGRVPGGVDERAPRVEPLSPAVPGRLAIGGEPTHKADNLRQCRGRKVAEGTQGVFEADGMG